MKIGFSTTCTFPVSIDESFRMGKEAGFDGIEVMVSANKMSRDPKYLNFLEEKHGLPILSFHAPTLLLTHFVWSKDPAVKLAKTADLAAEVGANVVVVHPPYRWQKEYASQFLQLVNKIEKDSGVTIAVENMFPWRVNGKEVPAYTPNWETIVEETNHLTYDFSHAALSGWDSLSVLPVIKNKLAHIHLCDGIGTSLPEGKDKVFDEHLLPGMGGQRVAESLQYLQKENWNGHVVAEVNTRKAINETERFNTLAYVAKWTKAVLGREV